jgi:hypothetical protein
VEKAAQILGLILYFSKKSTQIKKSPKRRKIVQGHHLDWNGEISPNLVTLPTLSSKPFLCSSLSRMLRDENGNFFCSFFTSGTG